VERLQADSPSANYGITKFSDLSTEEFQHSMLMQNKNPKKIDHVINTAPITVKEPAFDWRDSGAVTPVKNQEQCGSCWAFSAVEAIESAWIINSLATNTTIDLAPQQIVDCDSIGGVEGCNGGTTDSAYKYVIEFKGLESNTSYPYTGENGTCDFDIKEVVATISGYKPISKDETTLPDTLAATGPFSICLAASAWQDYTSGVLTAKECCQGPCQVDHCVQLVGYNTDAKVPYWIVRNSWAANWGVGGYIWLELGKNTCDLTGDITWPTAPTSA